MNALSANSTIEKLLNSAASDIEAGLILFNTSREKYFLSIIISFSTSIEKLCKVILLCKHPLTLKLAIKPEELLRYEHDPRGFTESLFSDHQESLVGLSAAWERVSAIETSLKSYDAIVKDISKYRNHHFHSYCAPPSEIALKAAFSIAWRLCSELYEKIPTSLRKHSLKETLGDGLFDRIDELTDEFIVATDFAEEQKRVKAFLKKMKKRTISEFAKTWTGWDCETELGPVECPFCNKNFGFTGCTLEPDYREDNEGTVYSWESPEGFTAEFQCFVCLECGAFVDSTSVFEELGKDGDSVKPPCVSFDWDIEEGLTDIEVVDPKEETAFGKEVYWSY